MNQENIFPRVLVAQLGARKHYQEPILFHQWGILNKLYTDFYFDESLFRKILHYKFLYKNHPKFIKKALERYTPYLNKANIIHFPKLAYTYNCALKKAQLSEKSQININIGKKFCQKIIDYGLDDIDVVYGFDGACLELFEYAKNKGIKCVLDQTIAERSLIHELLLQEEQLWSGWSKFPFQVYEGDLELVKRQKQEQQLADCIICGSSFVKESLIAEGVELSKIFVVPLGNLQDSQSIKRDELATSPHHRDEGLRILFAGSVGLRKGIQYLLQALKQIKDQIPFSCKIVGSLDIKSEIVSEFKDVGEFLGLVTRSQMKELYSWSNVFVLPSVCEGSAMVTYEALNSQLPIITTYNTGSIIRDGVDGFIIPIRDSQIIASKLKLLYKNKIIQIANKSNIHYRHKINIDAQNKLKDCILAI